MDSIIYSNARAAAKRSDLPGEHDVMQLSGCADYDAAVSYLKNRGFEETEDKSFGNKYADRFLRIPADYHNIRAAVKAVYADKDAEGLLIDGGNIDKQDIWSFVRERKFGQLPKIMGDTAEKALKEITEGGSCDMIIDKGEISEMKKTAEESGDAFLIKFAGLFAELWELKMKDRRGNNDDFEKAAEERIQAFISRHMHDCFSAAPIMAYAYEKRRIYAVIRLILTAKKYKFPEEFISERVK